MSLQRLTRLNLILQRVSLVGLNRLSARKSSRDSIKDDKYYEHSVVANPSQNYILCWHPKQPLKYEHTKPITEEMEKDEGVLKKIDMRVLHKKSSEDLVIAELKSLTYTTKHIWYPRSEKRTKKDPKSREYL